MNLKEQELNKYQILYELGIYNKDNGCEQWYVSAFDYMLKPKASSSVVNLGCGLGPANMQLQQLGLSVTGIDIAQTGLTDHFIQAALWDLPEDLSFDYGFSCDVLEHIPTEMVALTLDNIRRVCRHGVFFAICTRPDTTGNTIGQTLHLTVQPWTWWQPLLESRWNVVDVNHPEDMIIFAGTTK